MDELVDAVTTVTCCNVSMDCLLLGLFCLCCDGWCVNRRTSGYESGTGVLRIAYSKPRDCTSWSLIFRSIFIYFFFAIYYYPIGSPVDNGR